MSEGILFLVFKAYTFFSCLRLIFYVNILEFIYIILKSFLPSLHEFIKNILSPSLAQHLTRILKQQYTLPHRIYKVYTAKWGKGAGILYYK